MTIEQIIEKFIKYPRALENGAGNLSKRWSCKREDIYEARRIVRNRMKYGTDYHPKDVAFNRVKTLKKKNNNILVIGDTHIPYEKEGYLEFCKEQYDMYDCNTVVHIGDLIDSHATSRHPAIPDAYSPGDELYYTKKKLKEWYDVFPEMKVVIGNHDIRAYKIAAESGISSKWMRGFADVLEVPNWQFEDFYEINDTAFVHGTGTSGVTSAYRRALNLGQNVVMGHLHSDSSILYHKLPNKTIWGMIVGCGVDSKSYGMNYARNDVKKSILACGVILNNTPIIKIMD